MIHDAYSYYKSDGLGSLIKVGSEKIVKMCKDGVDRIYPLRKNTVTVELCGTKTLFDASLVNIFGYDFTDDIERESAVIGDLLSAIETEDVFLDVGSNIGIYSIPVAQNVVSGSVVAVDPYRGSIEALEENAELNSCGDQIHTVNTALWNENTTLNLSVHPPTGHQIETSGETEVGARRGDQLLTDGYPEPTVVKIDVEGAEHQVIEGIEDILDSVRLLYCEIHHEQIEKFGNTPTEVVDRIEEHGFTVEDRFELGDDTYLKATKSR